ncbi:MAG: tetratricopeptide repeat protein [Alphaproteobacteria bacterium]|nr:tetratricopeptide repeat protein [Alphaproteobacteria bacterium]
MIKIILPLFAFYLIGCSTQIEESSEFDNGIYSHQKPNMNKKLTTAEAFADRGSFSFEIGEMDDAIKDFSEAIRLSPKNASYYYNRAEVYRILKQDTKASEDYKKAHQFGYQ